MKGINRAEKLPLTWVPDGLSLTLGVLICAMGARATTVALKLHVIHETEKGVSSLNQRAPFFYMKLISLMLYISHDPGIY